MNEKEWTSELRKRMADYQEPVNDELWERIESTLSEKSGSQEKARIVPLRRWAAAAAALLIVVGGGYYIHKKVNTGASVVETAAIIEKAGPMETPKALIKQENLDKLDNLDKLENLDKLAHLAHIESPSCPSSPLSPSSLSSPSHPTLTIEEDKQEPINHEERKQDEDLRVSQSTETSTMARNDGNERMRKLEASSQSVSSASHRSLGYERPQTIRPMKQEQPKLSAMLYAQNAMGGNDLHRDPVLMSMDKAAMYSEVEKISYAVNTRHAPIYLYNYEEITKHHQPVTFGLSLSYPLTSRLSVLSGVTYTKLSSDFIQKMNDTKVVNEQELHYVGVPVRFSYQLLSWKGFSLYGIAGGAADMNVKSSYTTEGMKGKARKDRVQFSADAAAGVQYQVLPQMGLYVEPGVKYYLDNKSRVDNYFKDHPFNFNLQVGVRYELSR